MTPDDDYESTSWKQQQQRRRRRRRRRPCSIPATAAIALVALATTSSSPSSSSSPWAVVQAAHPPSIKKKPNNNKKHNPKAHSKIRGSTAGANDGSNRNVAADVAVAAEGVIPLTKQSGSHNDKGIGGRVVIVEPPHNKNHQQAMQQTTNQQEGVSGGGNVIHHPWPHPDTFQENLRGDAKYGRAADFAGEPALYGGTQNTPQVNDNVEYYQNGQPLQQSSSSTSYNQYNEYNEDGNNNDDNISYEQWMSAQGSSSGVKKGGGRTHHKGVHVANYMPQQVRGNQLGQSSQQMEYEEWLEVQGQGSGGGSQQHQQGQAYGDAPPPATADSATKSESKLASPTPLDDLDVVSGKQVILRPRIPAAGKPAKMQKKMALPPMGSASQSNSGGNVGNDEPMVFYYDPQSLQSTPPKQSSGNNNNNSGEAMAPELTLPEIVYDSTGRPLKLETLHAGGRNEVYLEVKPRAVWGASAGNNVLEGGWNAIQEKFNPNNNIGGDNGGSGTPSSQDQLIVLFTVATMAIMVGALVAQRLRSKRLLESCMHPELDDDDDDGDWGSHVSQSQSRVGIGSSPRYDKKFDDGSVTSPRSSSNGENGGGLNSGFGALLGGRNSSYGTGGDGGGLHWRGDMEKFDV